VATFCLRRTTKHERPSSAAARGIITTTYGTFPLPFLLSIAVYASSVQRDAIVPVGIATNMSTSTNPDDSTMVQESTTVQRDVEEENRWETSAAAYKGGVSLQDVNLNIPSEMNELFGAFLAQDIGKKSRLRAYIRRLQTPAQQQPNGKLRCCSRTVVFVY
jgi:hypothetical protein